MTRQSTVILAVVVLIILIGGLLAATKLMKPTPAPVADTVSSTPAPPEPTKEPLTKTSFKSLLGLGKNTNCTIAYPDNKGTGTVYVADKKMRADTVTGDVKGKSLESHVLSDGEFMYMWTGTQGSKIKVSAIEKLSSPSTSQSNPTQSLDQELDMKCESWSIDPTKFVVPTDVKFTDISAMVSNVKSSGIPKVDKSVCDSISDPTSKAACLKAVGGSN